MKSNTFKILLVVLLLLLVQPNSNVSNVLASGGVIAFGDSNTSGSYLPREFPEYPNHNWPALVGAENEGISGNTTASAVKRFKSDVLDKRPSSVVMMFGINDALIRPDTKQPQISKIQFEKNITSMVALLKARKVKVILMTNLPVIESVYYNSQSVKNPDIEQLYASKGGLQAWEDSYNDIIRRVAKKYKVQLIDNYKNAVIKAGDESEYMLKQSGLIDPLLGIHWTPRGHSLVAYSVNHYLSK